MQRIPVLYAFTNQFSMIGLTITGRGATPWSRPPSSFALSSPLNNARRHGNGPGGGEDFPRVRKARWRMPGAKSPEVGLREFDAPGFGGRPRAGRWQGSRPSAIFPRPRKASEWNWIACSGSARCRRGNHHHRGKSFQIISTFSVFSSTDPRWRRLVNAVFRIVQIRFADDFDFSCTNHVPRFTKREIMLLTNLDDLPVEIVFPRDRPDPDEPHFYALGCRMYPRFIRKPSGMTETMHDFHPLVFHHVTEVLTEKYPGC